MSKIKWQYCCKNCGNPDVSVEAFVHFDMTTQAFEVIEVCDKGHNCPECGETKLTRVQLFEPGNDTAEFTNRVLQLLHFTPEWSADTLDRISAIANEIGFVETDCVDFTIINSGD